MSAEVRAKPVLSTEIEQFSRDLAEAGITRGMVVAFAANQPALPNAEVLEQIAQERGVLMTTVSNIRDMLLSAFAWNTQPLPEVLAEFPGRVSARLQDIDADIATIRRWEELMQVETDSTPPMSSELRLFS